MSKLHIKELDRVVLLIAIPQHGLNAGDLGTVVDVYGEGEGFEVEFCTLTGETIAVATLDAADVRPVDARDVANARRLAS